MSEPLKINALVLGVLILEAESGQLALGPPVHDGDVSSPHAPSRVGGIDSRVARAHHHNIVPNCELARRFVSCDELQRIDDVGMIRARNAQFMHRAQADSYEDRVVFLFQRRQGRSSCSIETPKRNSTPSSAIMATSRRLSGARNLYSATP